MADQSDVETALVELIGAVLYPQGAVAPCILGRVCRIYRGWPNAAALDADLAAGRVNVTVFPQLQGQRNTTRWLDRCDVIMRAQPTLTVAVVGTTATFGGVADPGQVAGLRADNVAVVHRTTVGDTPALVAAILASQLRTQRITLLSGASVTVPGVNLLIGRTVADQTVQQATRRQLQEFRITCWCPDPGTRDLAAASV